MENNETVKTQETNQEQDKTEPTVAELQEQLRKLESMNEKLRQANTSASAEASKYKKQYNELLPEKERLENAQKEQEASLRQELEELKAERNVANYKSQLLSVGVDDELSQEMAVAINGGDTAKLFDGLRRFIAAHDKQLKENAFRTNPTLPGGETPKAVTKEQFDKMGYTERLEVFNKHPDLYKEFTK